MVENEVAPKCGVAGSYDEVVYCDVCGEELTAPLAKELIDHIDVYESEGKGKNKTQRIVIYYRFVGYIELPDKIPIVNDTRQGVAVNYISGALPETA